MRRRVCIEPGHGGGQPGAVGPTGVQEKNIALAVSRLLRERLVTPPDEALRRAQAAFGAAQQRGDSAAMDAARAAGQAARAAGATDAGAQALWQNPVVPIEIGRASCRERV